MKNLFFMGGPLFMSILTLLFLTMAVWIFYHLVVGINLRQPNKEKVLRKLGYGKSIGLFAMITGILGQLLGFFEAFSAIEEAADISPAMVFSGIKVSMITTLYGIFIYLFALLLWFGGSLIIERKLENHE